MAGWPSRSDTVIEYRDFSLELLQAALNCLESLKKIVYLAKDLQVDEAISSFEI